MAEQVTGVILAGGRGSRMGSMGLEMPKSLVPLGSGTLLAHQLSLLNGAGIERVIVVVGHLADQIEDEVSSVDSAMSVELVHQAHRLGSAHALAQLRGAVDGPFVVLLGDYAFDCSNLESLVSALTNGADGAVVVTDEPNSALIRAACEVVIRCDGTVARVLEKPVAPMSQTKGCGVYAFTPVFLDSLARTPRSALRNEYELSDAIDLFAQAGNTILACRVLDWDCNITVPSDVLRANIRWLRHRALPAVVHPHSSVAHGIALDEVTIARGGRLRGSGSVHQAVVFPGADVEVVTRLERVLVYGSQVLPADLSTSDVQPTRRETS